MVLSSVFRRDAEPVIHGEIIGEKAPTAYADILVQGKRVRCVIDTGATHDLFLTRRHQKELGLDDGDTQIDVEDFRGHVETAPNIPVEVEWLGELRTVWAVVDKYSSEALIGLGLLRDTCICFEGDTVTIKPVGRKP